MKKQEKKENDIADKIIKELQDAGLTFDQMIDCIRLAKEKYNSMKKTK